MRGIRRLSLTATATAIVLIVVGAVVRASGSGLGCPDWPKCHGSWVPPFEASALIEYTHRLTASVLGLLVLALAVVAWLRYRDRRAIFWPSIGALGVVIFQGWIGRQVVLAELPRGLVALHFFTAMAVLALLTFATVNSYVPRGGGFDRFARLSAGLAAGAFGVMMAGAFVAQAGAALAFSDWPLMGGRLLPDLDGVPQLIHFLHRTAVAAGTVLVVWMAVAAVREKRDRSVTIATHSVLFLWLVQIAVGALNVLGRSAPWAIVLHVMFAACAWTAVVALTVLSYRKSEAVPEAAADGAGAPRRRTVERIRAYIRLTKPRIIELLLITTVPAMIVATGGWPPVGLIAATLIGGTLAAGCANSINCFLDRDIDERMRRTAVRPIPTREVTPRAALVFGIVLGVVGVVWLAAMVNLPAAALALGAIVFYVAVYTVWLKRSTPANIVIGGAAGAAPVLVGWAAVTGTVELAPLVMFAIVFYWTPPHFWALSIRYADDYRSAGVPMLVVVKGPAETSRQILLYSLALGAVSLLLYPASELGMTYLISALVLGTALVVFAWRLRRSPDERTAMGLFRFSITYLVLLFVTMAFDALVASPRPQAVAEAVLVVAGLGFLAANGALLVTGVSRREMEANLTSKPL